MTTLLSKRLQRFLTVSTCRTFSPKGIFWFSLSMTFAATYGIMVLQQAFRSEYVVEDDLRVFLVLMQRFLDPELFPDDFIADYFKAVTPSGYAAFFWLMAKIGISPLLLSKLLPVVLVMLATAYCFGVCMQILPVPVAGFIATLLMNQNLWMKAAVSSTPRFFAYPLLLAFSYYLLRRSLLPCLIVIVLQGLFYPPFVLILSGLLILQLLHWENGRLRFSRERRDYLFCAAGLGVALLVMLPYALASSHFGPTITADEARTIPEFWKNGRSPFFSDDPREFYLYGWQSGILHAGLLEPRWVVWTGLLLPILLQYPSLFPLVSQIKSKVTLLLQIVLVSLGMFVVAHAVLLKLYFPNRYTRYPLQMVMAMAAGIALTVIVDAVVHWAKQRADYHLHWRQFIALGASALLGTALILYPVYLNFRNYNFPRTPYGMVAQVPQLYDFFSKQPKDILIASLSSEVDNLPTFSKRSILVGWEYANPYHLGYYRQIRQRATDLIRAQYSENLTEVQTFIEKYGVDFWLLDRSAFTPKYMTKNSWFKQWQPIAKDVLKNLDQGAEPILSKVRERCSIMQTENLVVLPAECITK